MRGPDLAASGRAAMQSLIPAIRTFVARQPLRRETIIGCLIGCLVCAGLTRVAFAILDDLLPSIVTVAMALLSITPFFSRVMRYP